MATPSSVATPRLSRPRPRLWAVLLLSVAAVLSACRRGEPPSDYDVDLLLPMTPVKDQGTTELCWAYAMLATIETEHLLRGDSVNLSALYVGRVMSRLRPKSAGQRAMCQTLLNVIARHGVVPYDVLPDDATDELPTPRWVFMLGARYTPQEFAHSVCAPSEYVALTCIPDSPYYKKVEVPVPDNWEHNRMLNLPLDTLRAHVDSALRSRHPVCWESRRHAMAIVGMARDRQTRAPYYILKNSWGTDQPHGGLVYMSRDALWADAVAVYMTRDAYTSKPQKHGEDKQN